MITNAVSWFEIYVEDMTRARKFYETVLGVTMQNMPTPGGEDEEMVAFKWTDDAPGAAGALVKSDSNKPSQTGTIVYFASTDCDIELSRVEEAGGTIVSPKVSIGEFGSFAVFSDTEGNTIGFYSAQ